MVDDVERVDAADRRRTLDYRHEMPKPQNVEHNIRDWLAENGHDDLVAWARLKLVQVDGGFAPGTHVSMEGSSASPGAASRAMGLGDRENALIPGYTHAFVLTGSEFFVVMLTAFKERVKQLWVESPSAGLSLYYLDAPMQRGHVVRYMGLDLPEGRLAPNGNPATFVFDSFVHTTKGGKKTPFVDVSDEFIAAFGDNAHRIDA